MHNNKNKYRLYFANGDVEKEKGLYDRCLRVAQAIAIFHKRFERLPK